MLCFLFSARIKFLDADYKSTRITVFIFSSYTTNLLCNSLQLFPNPGVTISTYAPLPLLLSGDLFASVPIFVGSVFSSPCLNVTPSSKTIWGVGERENERVNVGETGDGQAREGGGGNS